MIEELGNSSGLPLQMILAIASFLIYGNAVNGNGAPSGDEWNKLEVDVLGINANPSAPSAEALTILMTVIGLAVGLILLGSM